MSRLRFARTLRLSPRTVGRWVSRPETVPRPHARDALDALLAGADPAVRERFGQFAAPKPPAAPETDPARAGVCLYGDSDQDWDPGELEAFGAGARDAQAGRDSGAQATTWVVTDPSNWWQSPGLPYWGRADGCLVEYAGQDTH
jgi:hypothetical protein